MAIDDLQQQIEAEVRDAVQGVELTWRRVEAARQARDLAAQTLDLERERLRAGRTSNFEVLSFETALRAADSQALDAEISYLNAITSARPAARNHPRHLEDQPQSLKAAYSPPRSPRLIRRRQNSPRALKLATPSRPTTR